MSTPSAAAVAARLARVRAHADALSLDALVVTHLPNVRYLTGFVGTGGLVVLTRSRCFLVVDFRYDTAARTVAADLGRDLVTVEVSDRSYDETLVGILQREHAARIGVEAAWLPVGRYNLLSTSLRSSSGESAATTLVPTERLVERVRMVKDEGEIAIFREAGRRLSTIARRLPSFVAPGRRERDVAFAIDVAMVLLVVGVRESARFNATMVVIKLVAVLFFIVVGVGYVNPTNWSPFAPYGWSGIM